MTDILTSQYFCNLIGVATVETTSVKKDNSIEGDIEQYGQKNVSSVKRNLLNADEILRIPSSKLLVILSGNEPLLLDKIFYKNHPLANKLKDCPVSDYTPNWTKNLPVKIKNVDVVEKKEQSKEDSQIDWNTFWEFYIITLLNYKYLKIA